MKKRKICSLDFPLNGICPYFTMFPLSFPHEILSRYSKPTQIVLDPFCGRGTTNFAARVQGLETVGIDSSKVAVAIAQSKVIDAAPEKIVRLTQSILNNCLKKNIELPKGEFWKHAFHRDTLISLCILRDALLNDCRSNTRIALRGLILGALHGPLGKNSQSYFSNQCPRTFAPKPDYSVHFWRKHKFIPPKMDIVAIVQKRAQRYFSQKLPNIESSMILADSRRSLTFSKLNLYSKVDWIITSPPYYGMSTYIPDQWLRMWFLGEQPKVRYSDTNQLDHKNPDDFAENLKIVWQHLTKISQKTANLIIRFGGIGDRTIDPLDVIKLSLKNSGWKMKTIKSAGLAAYGRRQSLCFSKNVIKPMEEYDIWASPEF